MSALQAGCRSTWPVWTCDLLSVSWATIKAKKGKRRKMHFMFFLFFIFMFPPDSGHVACVLGCLSAHPYFSLAWTLWSQNRDIYFATNEWISGSRRFPRIKFENVAANFYIREKNQEARRRRRRCRNDKHSGPRNGSMLYLFLDCRICVDKKLIFQLRVRDHSFCDTFAFSLMYSNDHMKVTHALDNKISAL